MHQLYDFQYAVQKSKSYVISCHIICSELVDYACSLLPLPAQ